MSYKNIFLILLTIIIVSTLCILISKPKMHKVTMIYDSNYVVSPNETVEIEEKNIPTVELKQQTSTTNKKVNTVTLDKISTPTKTSTTKKQVAVKPAPVVQKEVKKTVQPQKEIKTQTKVQPQKEIKTVTAPVVQTVQKQIPVQKPIQKVEQAKTVQHEAPKKVLTAQEEEIAWNIWRSNLQNQIMKDVRLPIIPNGIIFKFTFDVDKFGKVSNVQTWSTTPSYTPYAVQFIAPVIRSYQGRSILNFPTGSNRTTTHVTGGWRISTNTKYSTPNDYNDTEKVVR